MKRCKCGCGGNANAGRTYISGHNLRGMTRTAQHRANIAKGQRRVWKTNRRRLPVGTKRVAHDGYVRVKVLAGKGRWALEHVLVIQKRIGRKIRKGEIIHHINRDRSDNAPRNLFLCQSHGEHNRVEASLYPLVKPLIEAGVVLFNQKEGSYELA